MTLRQRLGLPTPADDRPRCNCRFPERHYGSTACTQEAIVGPDSPGVCWGCYSAGHDRDPDQRPEWQRRMNNGKIPLGVASR